MGGRMASRRAGSKAAALGLAGVFALAGGPALAQIAGDLTLQSDCRVRAHSLSEGRPAVTLDLPHDFPAGYSGNGPATDGRVEGEAELIGLTANVRYARRLSTEISVDGGILWSQYRNRYYAEDWVDNTEAYVG